MAQLKNILRIFSGLGGWFKELVLIYSLLEESSWSILFCDDCSMDILCWKKHKMSG
jgi:hypothetical protein